MKFQPLSADDIAREGLFPDGEYTFEVIEAVEAVSKAGNEMLKVKLTVIDDQGDQRTVYDYLVSNVMRKVRSFAVSVGMLDEYERGTLVADDLPGKSGRVKIKTDASPGYEPKNAVAYYIDKPKASVFAPQRRQPAPASTVSIDEDSIPF